MNLAMYAGKLGELPETVGLPWDYFQMRGCFLDCRGPLAISASSKWGYQVKVVTQTHDIGDWPELGPSAPYGVTVEDNVWIGSLSLLTGCTIRAGSIVAAGTVVRGQIVGPNVMVAGNPARVIARWDVTQWKYLPPTKCGFVQELV